MIKKNDAFSQSARIRSAEQLGAYVRRLRKLRELSQIQLAQKAGLTQATISKVERGNHKSEIETLFLIFSALQMDFVILPRPDGSNKNSQLQGLF